jgi:Cys-tRNA synthase (O-phospho-L-seryl-tRNA:Cys-tRNA synthase)
MSEFSGPSGEIGLGWSIAAAVIGVALMISWPVVWRRVRQWRAVRKWRRDVALLGRARYRSRY